MPIVFSWMVKAPALLFASNAQEFQIPNRVTEKNNNVEIGSVFPGQTNLGLRFSMTEAA